MKSATRSPAIRRAVESARQLGYRVEFMAYVEDASTPGMLGRLAGLCDRSNKVIRVKTVAASREQLAFVIRHELEHADGTTHGTNHAGLDLHCAGPIRVSGGSPNGGVDRKSLV